MLTIKRVLFPTDYTACAECAFSHAVRLADRFDAELHILHAVAGRGHNPEGTDLAFNLNDADVTAQLHLDFCQSIPPTRTHDLPIVHAVVQTATASAAILDYADRHDIDLIVMGTHGRHGLEHLISGSVAEEVVRAASCPVFTLKDCHGVAQRPRMRRILVPVDFSDHVHAAMVYAKELAAAYGAGVDFLHVVEEAVLPHVYGIEPVSPGATEVLTRTRKALQKLVDSVGAGLYRSNVYVILGHAATDIGHFAEQLGSDMIVISTHGRTGLKRFVMGSVAEAVVRTASCPVFTVKSFGKPLIETPAGESVSCALK